MRSRKKIISLLTAFLMLIYVCPVNRIYAVTGESNADYSVSELTEKTGSDYGYKDIAERSNPDGRRLFYNMLMKSMENFMYGDIEAPTIPNVYSGDIYAAGAYILEEYGLTFNEASEVYETFRRDNPVYYFISNVLYGFPEDGQTYLIAATDEIYAKPADRKKYNEKIKKYIDGFSSCTGKKTLYEKAKAIHDKLILSMNYVFGDNDKSYPLAKSSCIIGAAEGYGNSEAYARAYYMLCNYYGLDSIFISGDSSFVKNGRAAKGNSWNIIKLDDGKYYSVDCCMDDTGDELNYASYQYFAAGSSVFNETHKEYSPDNSGAKFLYTLPAINKYRYQTENLTKLIEKTSSDYGYSGMEKLSNPDGRKKLYNHIMDDMIRLWGDNDLDFDPLPTDYGTEYIRNIYMTEQYGLSKNEAAEVYYTFRNDNPVFYYMSNKFHVTGNENTTAFLLNVFEDFAKGSTREKYNKSIYGFIESFSPYVKGVSEYEDAKAIHDRLILSMEYAHEKDGKTPLTNGKTQSIIGAVEGQGICDAYSRMYNMLCNYYGIKSIYVSGSSHSWNIVKLDDGKYYNVDCTWDDAGGNKAEYTYFASGTKSFYKNHTPNSPKGNIENYLYSLPEISESDYPEKNTEVSITTTAAATKPAVSIITITRPATTSAPVTKATVTSTAVTKPAVSIITTTKPTTASAAVTKLTTASITVTKPPAISATSSKPAVTVTTAAKPSSTVTTVTKPVILPVTTATKPTVTVITSTKPAITTVTTTGINNNLKGDIDKNGTVSVSDYVIIEKYLINAAPFSTEQFSRADINSDGIVNIFDAVLMKRILLFNK